MSVEHDELMHDIRQERRQKRNEANMPVAIESFREWAMTDGIDMLMDLWLDDVPEAIDVDWQRFKRAIVDHDTTEVGAIVIESVHRLVEQYRRSDWGRDRLNRILEDMEHNQYEN